MLTSIMQINQTRMYGLSYMILTDNLFDKRLSLGFPQIQNIDNRTENVVIQISDKWEYLVGLLLELPKIISMTFNSTVTFTRIHDNIKDENKKFHGDMILTGTWAMVRPGEDERIIRSPIHVESHAITILSSIRPKDHYNRLFFDVFSLRVWLLILIYSIIISVILKRFSLNHKIFSYLSVGRLFIEAFLTLTFGPKNKYILQENRLPFRIMLYTALLMGLIIRKIMAGRIYSLLTLEQYIIIDSLSDLASYPSITPYIIDHTFAEMVMRTSNKSLCKQMYARSVLISKKQLKAELLPKLLAGDIAIIGYHELFHVLVNNFPLTPLHISVNGGSGLAFKSPVNIRSNKFNKLYKLLSHVNEYGIYTHGTDLQDLFYKYAKISKLSKYFTSEPEILFNSRTIMKDFIGFNMIVVPLWFLLFGFLTSSAILGSELVRKYTFGKKCNARTS